MNDTKTKIITGAIDIFSKNPSASIEEIGASIHLSRRTLHRYFSSKSDLIAEITAYASNFCLHKTKLAVKSSEDPIDQLKTMFYNDIESGSRYRFLYTYRDSMEDLEATSADFQEMMHLFRKLLQTLQNRKQLEPIYTLEWIEKLYFSTINAAIDLIQTKQSNEQEIVKMAWTSYYNSILKK
ncbi:TetR/AcrR family transcriptional regulator [Carboxylicivirga mesophila]|uniref:TetR/AcrR family transcriptional regulator n=1 Tax=Carboxylicivirga mesophila TaxID=1166478 RepID=A0ABS5KD22_9BACT|nr:helix-turn-helix domain-containing protein [Carboxylicivirga mesophila]MBS2212890.1 TetR/AcrR family transcriptional regulator [Carboxylicivirga mesophila]